MKIFSNFFSAMVSKRGNTASDKSNTKKTVANTSLIKSVASDFTKDKAKAYRAEYDFLTGNGYQVRQAQIEKKNGFLCRMKNGELVTTEDERRVMASE